MSERAAPLVFAAGALAGVTAAAASYYLYCCCSSSGSSSNSNTKASSLKHQPSLVHHQQQHGQQPSPAHNHQHHASLQHFEQDEVLAEQLTRNVQFFGLAKQKCITNSFVVVIGLGVSWLRVGSHFSGNMGGRGCVANVTARLASVQMALCSGW